MRGTARTTAAISFVNALFTGVGSAAAVSLSVDATVELTPARGTARIEFDPACDTPLARAALGAALRRFAPDRDLDVTVAVRSEIPPARGLKSSSAVSAAIISATARAAGQRPPEVDVARISAEVARTAGISATGALDDALAAVGGGAVVTDTSGGRVLRRDSLPPDWGVVLYVPREHHLPSTRWADAFAHRASEGRAAADLARAGHYLKAMERNTELVEGIVGLDYRPLRRELERQGALGCGVSGMGPTLAAVGPSDRLARLHAALPVGRAERWILSFVAPTGEGERP